MNRLIKLIIVISVAISSIFTALTWPAAAADMTAKTFLAPQTMTVGTPVAVGGIGGGGNWNSGEAINVWLATATRQRDWTSPRDSGDIVATAVADSAGNWGTSFIMPDRKSGPVDAAGSRMHEVYIQGSTNFALFTAVAVRTLFPTPTTPAPNARADTPQNALIVKPWVDRSPSSGPPGTTVTLKGSGFAGNETGITVQFGTSYAPFPTSRGGVAVMTDSGPFLKIVASGITATSRGAWTATFVVPDGPAARYALMTTGDADAVGFANISFEIVQGIKITPASGPLGSTVSFTGWGFTGVITVALDMIANVLETEPVTITAGITGIVAGTARIPSDGVFDGPHEFIIRDAIGRSGSAVLTVSRRAATLTLSPASGLGTVTLNGRYFTQGSPVDIFFDGKKVPGVSGGGDVVLTTGPASSAGFTAVISVPTVKPGQYEVMAVDVSGILGRATFTVPALPGAPGPPGPVVSVVEKGARLPVTALDTSSNPVSGATVNLVNVSTGATAASGATNALGLLVLTAPNVTAQTWFRVESSSGSANPRRVLVLDTNLLTSATSLSSASKSTTPPAVAPKP